MAQPTIKVLGLSELRRAMRDAGSDMADLRSAGAEAAEVVVEEGHRIVPRLDGDLDATIRAAGQVGGAVVRAGNARVPYAAVIHFGWPGHNIEPQPFLYDALDLRRDEVIAVYEDRVQELADSI